MTSDTHGHEAVSTWVDAYERLWRTPGTDALGELFTDDATYRTSPWAEPVQGLPALAAFWEDGRDGPDEDFTMRSSVVAVDGATAVVRVEVDYGSGDRGATCGSWSSRRTGAARRSGSGRSRRTGTDPRFPAGPSDIR